MLTFTSHCFIVFISENHLIDLTVYQERSEIHVKEIKGYQERSESHVIEIKGYQELHETNISFLDICVCVYDIYSL